MMTRTQSSRVSLDDLNSIDEAAFVELAGPWFESAPWVAQRTHARRPFLSLGHLHQRLCETVFGAPREDQVRLISAHPALVGRAALAGQLTAESSREQAAAG